MRFPILLASCSDYAETCHKLILRVRVITVNPHRSPQVCPLTLLTLLPMIHSTPNMASTMAFQGGVCTFGTFTRRARRRFKGVWVVVMTAR